MMLGRAGPAEQLELEAGLALQGEGAVRIEGG